MECVVCGRASSYNRAVVDVVADAELGVLCPTCESAQFGEILATGEWTDDECVLCHRDGYYAFPAWTAYVVEVNGKSVARSEYTLEDPCPRLCDKHFTHVCGEDTRTKVPSTESSAREV